MKRLLVACVLGLTMIGTGAFAAYGDQNNNSSKGDTMNQKGMQTTTSDGCCGRVEVKTECEEVVCPCPPCCPEDDTCGRRPCKPKCEKPKCPPPKCERPCEPCKPKCNPCKPKCNPCG